MDLLCRLLGHRRSHAVWFDDQEFRAPCKRCGRPMVKDGATGRWRIFSSDRDYAVARSPRPDGR